MSAWDRIQQILRVEEPITIAQISRLCGGDLGADQIDELLLQMERCGSAHRQVNQQSEVWYYGKETTMREAISTGDTNMRTQGQTPTIENALRSALHSHENANKRWRLLIERGATDEELTEAIAGEWGLGGGASEEGGYRYKGGKHPEFAWPSYVDQSKATRLKGKALLTKVREVMGIAGPRVISAPVERPDSAAVESKPAAPTQAKADAKKTKPARPQQESNGIPSNNGNGNGNGHIDLREIPLDQIVAWRDGQMRTNFDDAKLKELAESIKQKGVLQPVLVRPIKHGFTVQPPLNGWTMFRVVNRYGAVIRSAETEEEAGAEIEEIVSKMPRFELIAGERRWRASKIAGAATIPAIVRELDDRAALEIQVIENLQRSDLSALEEASGYKRLIAEHGYTADSLAEKLGKSKSYVYGRLKLAGVPEVCAKALSNGEITPSIAELIGRVPNEALRKKLCADLFRNADKGWYSPPTYRSTKDLIERTYMKELKGAPFDQNDKKLLPSSGSCKACPNRTGNNRIEYPDGRADVCTDPACFTQKVEAHQKREMEKLASAGARILDKEENEKYLDYGWLTNAGKREFIDLDEECDEVPEISSDDEDNEVGIPTYGAILGDSVQIEAIGTDQRGNTHRLVSREAAAAALKEKGIELEPVRKGHDPEDWKKRQQAEEKKRKIRQAVVVEASEAVGKAIAGKYRSLTADSGGIAKLFQVLIGRYSVRFGQREPDRIVALAKRRGKTIERNQSQITKQAPSLVEGLETAETIGLFAEMLVISDLDGWASGYISGKPESSICDLAGVDLKEIEKRLSKEQREKTKAQGKGAAK